jgi:hypothetical protein
VRIHIAEAKRVIAFRVSAAIACAKLANFCLHVADLPVRAVLVRIAPVACAPGNENEYPDKNRKKTQ